MKHLVIETNCMYNYKKNSSEIPKCCKFGVGNISINCLVYQKNPNKICPYLVFGTAKSTLVLTNEMGEAVNAVEFWADLELSSEEWKSKEKDWIKKNMERLEYLDN